MEPVDPGSVDGRAHPELLAGAQDDGGGDNKA
jgi:hypothetical protein